MSTKPNLKSVHKQPKDRIAKTHLEVLERFNNKVEKNGEKAQVFMLQLIAEMRAR